MMKKIATLAAGMAISITAVMLLAPAAKSKKIRMNSKDLPEHRVRLISPSNPAYKDEIEREKEGKSPEDKRAMEMLEPFSAFLKNDNDRALLAYSLKWEITREDGKTVTYFASYSDADALSGADTSAFATGPAVRPGSRRFVTLVSQVSQGNGIGSGPNLHTTGDGSDVGNSPIVNGSSGAPEEATTELQQASDLTVSVDSAVFDDGRSVGPDAGRHFDRLQALLNARNDLLRGALNSIRQGKKVEDVMSRIKEISETEGTLGSDKPADLYQSYRKEFASEIIRTRAAVGDDKTALWYAFQPLTKKWPKLRKEP